MADLIRLMEHKSPNESPEQVPNHHAATTPISAFSERAQL